ncbi:GTP 3',8-cyclase MoaA, partial [Pseudomonas aeruginosa]|nr:GTP 3',8-cyclase MoaA [Pseudomonas aeruginosa]
ALDLRELLRSHPGDRERLSAALVAALNLKPERHHFDAQEQVQVLRFMSMTGG